MKRVAAAVLAVAIVLTGCSKEGTPTAAAPPELVPANALDGLLLSPGDVDSLMGATG